MAAAPAFMVLSFNHSFLFLHHLSIIHSFFIPPPLVNHSFLLYSSTTCQSFIPSLFLHHLSIIHSFFIPPPLVNHSFLLYSSTTCQSFIPSLFLHHLSIIHSFFNCFHSFYIYSSLILRHPFSFIFLLSLFIHPHSFVIHSHPSTTPSPGQCGGVETFRHRCA